MFSDFEKVEILKNISEYFLHTTITQNVGFVLTDKYNKLYARLFCWKEKEIKKIKRDEEIDNEVIKYTNNIELLDNKYSR